MAPTLLSTLPQKNPIIEPFIDEDISISFISEMELLGVFCISKNHKDNIQNLINDCQIFEINQKIKFLAIDLKQKYKIKLADLIIAATAIHHNLSFNISNADFKKIK